MTIEIEHGLPVPNKGGRPLDPGYQLVPMLKRGDSLFLPGKKLSTVRTYLAGPRFADLRRKGFRFRVAEATKDGLVGTRVWRVDGL
jgi:hypothetical protein